MIPLPKISEPAKQALASIGVHNLDDAIKLSDEELLALHGFGKKGVDILRSYHIQYHKDGSLWAYGRMVENKSDGYWQWFRKDGTRLRTGYFDSGKRVGEWTTFDKAGDIYKVTKMKG